MRSFRLGDMNGKLLGVVCVLLTLAACNKDDEKIVGPIAASFALTVEGEAPNAEIIVVNTTTGASEHKWTITYNTTLSTVMGQNPPPITAAHPGVYKVILEASNDENREVVDKNITVNEALKAWFSVEVTGKAPNATITLTNESVNADKFKWVFDDALEKDSSYLKAPSPFVVSKGGQYKITLYATNDTDNASHEVTLIVVEAVVPAFDLEVVGVSPQAVVQVTNKTTGASTYRWTIGEGGSYNMSQLPDPPEIMVDKAGAFTVTMKVSNGSEQAELSKMVTINGSSAILTFQNRTFAFAENNPAYGQYFSILTGDVYLKSQINPSLGVLIDLVFSHSNMELLYFQGPSATLPDIPNAPATTIDNFPAAVTITVENFTQMTNDLLLAPLEVAGVSNSFQSNVVPHVVLFTTQDNRNGAILVKEVDGTGVIADIKVQKY